MTERRQPGCAECAIAEFGPWQRYSRKCPQCQIRMLTDLDAKQREVKYEQIERDCGTGALACVKRQVFLEIGRRHLLREGADT